MPADVNDTFRDAAARPSHDVPMRAIERRLRTRHRQRIGAAVASGALIASLIAGAGVLLTGGASKPIVRTTHPAEALASGGGLSVNLPDGWVQIPLDGAPHPVVLAVGTALLAPGTQADCATGPEHATDAFVLISIYGEDSAIPNDRPGDFANAAHNEAACPLSAEATTTTSGPGTSTSTPSFGRVLSFEFADNGFVLRAHITFGTDTPPSRQAEAFAVLNSLRVVATLPSQVQTTVPSTVPRSDDTKAITAAFLGWINTRPYDSDAEAQFIEDYANIRSAIHAAGVINGDPGGYTGRVDAITRVGANDADVIYSFIHNGQVAVPYQHGHAVKINGVWMVSRDTVCAAIAIDGTKCPPRA